jgi:hypothetical protein
MTAQEIYTLLENAGVDFEIVAIFEGSRSINFKVYEDEESLEIEE